MDRLATMDYGIIFARIGDIIRDPASNTPGALLLLGAVTIIVLILLIVGVMFIMNTPEDEEEGQIDGAEEWARQHAAAEQPYVAVEYKPLIPTTVVLVAIVAVVWVFAGVFTAQNSLCLSCHSSNPHTKANVKTDPHNTLNCVACHETGGVVGSATYMVAPRMIHFASGIAANKVNDGYSRSVSSSTCRGCHSTGISKTVTIADQGVRVSHKEPLDAGAECVDCHALANGVVSGQTVGMTPCLRCHDGKTASSKCEYCHIKDIGASVTASAESTFTPQVLVGEPNCYSCHVPTKCDACHGIRMPHTQEFIKHGHARAAAEDFWFNGGKQCSRCHDTKGQPCIKCHGQMPSHGMGPSWAKGHQYGDPKYCSQGCHGSKSSPTRPMCEFCHDPGIKPLPQPTAAATTTIQ